MPHFGIQIPGFAFPQTSDADLFERAAATAVAAEEAGFDSVWVMDHFYQLDMLGGPDEPILEGYTLLAALAARTQRVQLGTLVTGVTYRNPAVLAKQVTTLDIISAGRAILGIGAAWYELEHEGYGVRFPPLKERFDRLEEALQICRAMFREERPSFEGEYYRIREARNLPRPLRAGGPPILIGGGGEKRTLKLVAQYADFSNVFGGLASVRHKLDVLARHCDDIGRDPAEIVKTRLGSLIVTRDSAHTQRTRDELASRVGAAAVDDSYTIGEPEAVADDVARFLEAGLDGLLFNVPTSGDIEAIGLAGEALRKRFG